MSDWKNPEFELEAERFKAAHEFLCEEDRKLSEGEMAGGNEVASAGISFVYMQYRRRLAETKGTPYFGRVDYIEPNGEPQIAYVGLASYTTNGYHVISWHTPVAKLLHGSQEEAQVIGSTSSRRTVRLKLRRHFDGYKHELRDVHDSFNTRDPDQVMVAPAAYQEYLLRQLYHRGDPRLRAIIETIQAEQNDVIRAPAKQVLILNGVYGSGKTAIAYHRLSLLLSPENQLGLDFAPERTLVLGPNSFFLRSAEWLLPALGMDRINHHTYHDWAMRAIGFMVSGNDGRVRPYRLLDRAFSELLSPRRNSKEKEAAALRSRLKGSLKFATMIDRYVDARHREIMIPDDGLRYSDFGIPNVELHILASDVERVHKRLLNLRGGFENLRQHLQEELLIQCERALWEKLERSYARYQEETRKALRTKIKTQVEEMWPPADLRKEYYTLIRDADKLRRYSVGLLDEASLKLLVQAEVPPLRNVDVEDLPALHYLYLAFQGGARAIYDHIVVDEGQDLSPLHYAILRQYSRNDSLTILGDIAQGIFHFRGLRTWEDLGTVFDWATVNKVDITQSYRSTDPIVAFTNQVLQGIDETATQARPIGRDGDAVEIVRVQNEGHMFQVIHDDLHVLLKSGYENIAVVTKTDTEAKRTAQALNNKGLDVVAVTSASEVSSRTSVVVLSAALAKGSEFEAVLVSDASTKTYSETGTSDGRLLYVALTRALHLLRVYYYDEVSPYLAGLVARHGVNGSYARLSVARRNTEQYPQAQYPREAAPKPFASFSRSSELLGPKADAFQQSRFDPRSGGKGIDQMARDQGRFISTPLYDDYDEESSPD